MQVNLIFQDGTDKFKSVMLHHLKLKAEQVTTIELKEEVVASNLVAIIPNSENRGYCRPILSTSSV